MQAPNYFKCPTNCKHHQCQRHTANLGFVGRSMECECCSQLNLTGSAIFLENVVDIANTLSQVMILCGINECKAKTAVDIITYSFLHYDVVCYCLDAKPKKRLRKEDVFHELGRKCLMNRVEAHLCYTIIKRGFKAFYYQYQGEEYKDNGQPPFSQECVYVHAAKKTAESYAKFDGLSCDEQRGIEAKIKVAYKKFYDRMQARKIQPPLNDCNCSFCDKNGGSTPPTSCSPSKQFKKHFCVHCCPKDKSQTIESPPTVTANCPECHCPLKYCCCAKYQYNIDWIRSIWDRPDMQKYYKENIERREKATETECNQQDPHHSDEASEGEEEAEVVEGEEEVVEEVVAEKVVEEDNAEENNDFDNVNLVIESEEVVVEDNAEENNNTDNNLTNNFN